MTRPSADTPVPAARQATGPVISIDGQLGALLASIWYQGSLRSWVQVSPHELWRNRGHGVEILRDPNGTWSLIAVNHPWTGPPTATVQITRHPEGPRMPPRPDLRAHPTDGRLAQHFTLPPDLFHPAAGEKWLCLTVPEHAAPELSMLDDDEVADWLPVTTGEA